MKMMTAKSTFVFWLLATETGSLPAQQIPPPPAAPAAAPAATNAGPKIQFQTSVYDFGKIKSGEPVKYTFVFTNTGDAVLILANVQPSCGCTTAGEWSHQVEPGKTGTIPVQFNSANYGGDELQNRNVAINDK